MNKIQRHVPDFCSSRRLLLLAAAGAPWVCAAQAWPSKPIRIIVPGSPGSPSDTVVRVMSDVLVSILGQPVLVDNKAGAQGSIGLEALARSSPDGYTFGLVNLQSVAAGALRQNMPYKLATSFVPVAQLTFENPVLVVPTASPAHDLRSLVKHLKEKGSASYASSGAGTPSHLGMELFARDAGVKLLHVPYQGAAAAASDVAGGRVDLSLIGAAVATQLASSGRLKALAVSSDHRLTALPKVPTFAEAGFPDIDVRGWVGMVAPAKTSSAIIARMEQAVTKALQRPVVHQRLAMLGSSPSPSDSAAFGAFLAREEKRWAQIVKSAGITFQ